MQHVGGTLVARTGTRSEIGRALAAGAAAGRGTHRARARVTPRPATRRHSSLVDGSHAT